MRRVELVLRGGGVAVEFFDKVVKIDDPVGAISVHGCCGALGTLCVGLFATDGGLFYGGGVAKLGIQALGLVAVAAWVLATMFVIFKVIDKLVGLRVSEQIEIDGLDYAEHGLPTAYAGFAISDPTYANLELVSPNEGCDLGEDDIQKASEAKVNAAVSVVEPFAHSGMHNIVVCCKASKLDELKVALNKAGITGMTVSQVTGYGLQKGAGEMYRGVEVDARLLPKVKVEIVVGNIPYQRIVDVIKQVLYTGHIGDGKIFVSSVEKVIKVRTGEEDLTMIASHCPDMIVLDLGLPDMDGMEVLKSVRKWSNLPVVVVSARNHEHDKVEALDYGADDYLVKPFGTSELLARIRTAIRHTRTTLSNTQIAQSGKFVTGDLTIDYDKHQVLMHGENAGLTVNEYKIVALLGKYAGKVLTYDFIIRELWGPKAKTDNQILRVNMANIRRKIEPTPGNPQYIFTEVGVGYRMREGD